MGTVLQAGWAASATMMSPLVRMQLRRRVNTGREIAERLHERFGVDATARPAGPLLWMHAASVGETMSVLPVLEVLQRRIHVLVTTGTVTSQVMLAQRLEEHG